MQDKDGSICNLGKNYDTIKESKEHEKSISVKKAFGFSHCCFLVPIFGWKHWHQQAVKGDWR